jgi:hypothetical protein
LLHNYNVHTTALEQEWREKESASEAEENKQSTLLSTTYYNNDSNYLREEK